MSVKYQPAFTAARRIEDWMPLVGGWMTLECLAMEVDANEMTVRRHLRRLLREGRVEYRDMNPAARQWRWVDGH